jgi:hypothetical protein
MKIAEVVLAALHQFIDWQSTQPDAVCVSHFHSPVNAHTAVYDFFRRQGMDPHTRVEDWKPFAEVELEDHDTFINAFIDELGLQATSAEGVEPPKRHNFPPEFSIIENADETWILPLTAAGRSLAEKVIPPGTRTFGSHFILCGAVGHAIATSLRKAGAA